MVPAVSLPECPECKGRNTPAVHGCHASATAVVQYRQCRDCRWTFKTTKPLGRGPEMESLLG